MIEYEPSTIYISLRIVRLLEDQVIIGKHRNATKLSRVPGTYMPIE